jgi:hypothetical protein
MVSDDLPVDWGKFFLTFFIIAAVLGAAAWFIIGMMAVRRNDEKTEMDLIMHPSCLLL